MANNSNKMRNKPGCKTKSRRNNSRRGNFKSTDKERFDASTATNNPAWYGADSSLLRDSASLPFSYAVGMPINLHNPAFNSLPSGQLFTIPGFMALYLDPSVGSANDPADPINTAAFRTYTFVRHLNSGHVNYDAPDLTLYIIAMSQVYSYINFLQRAYGLVYTYAQKNRYLPNSLLTAMGIDPDNVRNNLASFRYGINILINKAASLCVPSSMSILSRHSSVYQNVYIEGESLKDQMYFYTPNSFWKFTLAPDNSGMLESCPFYMPARLKTVDELINYGSDMLSRLIQSEDMNIMSGDIRKAYGENIIKLQPLAVDFPITPIYDFAVLQQIKNSIVLGYEASSLDILQDSTHGYLLFQPEIEIDATGAEWFEKGQGFMLQTFLEDKILSVKSADPTPEEVMESSRNIPHFDNYKRTADVFTVQVHPCADMVTMCKIYFFDMDGDVPNLLGLPIKYTFTVNADDNNSQAVAFRTMSLLGHFKFHPMMHIIPLRAGSTSGSFNFTNAHLCFDVDNYTILNDTTIERMNEAALLSMLNVPTVAKVQ